MLKRCGAQAIEVRTARDLDACDGLVIPGGESTTMAHVAEKTGLLQHLRKFVVDEGRPVWGTCAGLIFLAKSAEGTCSCCLAGCT
jgi:pyridoxal 5'-phosphate synthase pdxT subunit